MFLITGYPKTGNTWLHVMISYVMNPNAMIDGSAEPPSSNIFSHCLPGFNTEPYTDMCIAIPGDTGLSGKRVLLLVRHPGDTLVSLYMHNVYRERFPMYHETIDDMVYDDIYGLRKFMVYYEWWWKHRKESDIVCIIRYEDLLLHTYETFSEALYKLQMTVPSQTIHDAIEFGSFENMQKLEKTNFLNWPTLYQSHRKYKKARKVREGKIGQYKKMLQPETIAFIDSHVNHMFNKVYGYHS